MVLSEILKATFLSISALFPIVNPLGGSPIFLSLTSDYARAERYTLSRLIALNSFFLLVGSYLTGTHILAFFGISLPVVQVGGGLVVISAAWAMLQRRGDDEREEVHRNIQAQDQSREAFYPLTLPLTVGPGSISVAITLGANAPHGYPVNLAAIAWCVNRVGGDCTQRLSLLRIRRPPGADSRTHRDERHCPVVVVSAGLHRGADPVEWLAGASLLGTADSLKGGPAPSFKRRPV
jgi:MarC family membrane protein